MTDLVEWLETAISEAGRLATAREETEDGWTETGWWVTRRTVSEDLDPLVHHSEDQARTALARHQNADAVLRRCAADREIVAKCVAWIDDGSGITSGAVLGRIVLEALAEGYGYQEETDHG